MTPLLRCCILWNTLSINATPLMQLQTRELLLDEICNAKKISILAAQQKHSQVEYGKLQ